jgi:hypothetical protein
VNADILVQLHPNFGRPESSLLWDALGFAPPCVSGPVVERTRGHCQGK